MTGKERTRAEFAEELKKNFSGFPYEEDICKRIDDVLKTMNS